MPRARLRLTLPEEVWIGRVSRDHPAARFRILAAHPGEGSGVGLAEVSAPDVAPVLADIEAEESVTHLDLLQRHDDEVLVQFETTRPLLLFPIQSSGVPLEMPFDIRDGEATWEITASRDRLSELGEQLDAFNIRFTVEHVKQHVQSERILTDRQRRLVRAAVERGYYDTPRECTLTDLADDLGIAKSTCSETLHRAEEKIVKRYVEELGEPETLEAEPAR